LEELIRKAKTPMLAVQLGREGRMRLRRNWELVEDAVMLEALRAKFTGHAGLKELLLRVRRELHTNDLH
jgi:N-glycosidase YbiA